MPRACPAWAWPGSSDPVIADDDGPAPAPPRGSCGHGVCAQVEAFEEAYTDSSDEED
jgi:hypothetical protein